MHPSPLNTGCASRLHREGDAIGFYAMRSNRVVPLARECEVVGGEDFQHPLEGETWEIGGELLTEGAMMIDGYYVTTDSFFQSTVICCRRCFDSSRRTPNA